MAEQGGETESIFLPSSEAWLSAVRDRYRQALLDTPPGTPPPSADDYLGATTEPIRSQLRADLDELARTFVAKSRPEAPAVPDHGATVDVPHMVSTQTADFSRQGGARPTGVIGWGLGPDETASRSSDAPRDDGFRLRGLGPDPSRYTILGVLGRGGMGIVYKARQIGLDRTVALKMILAGAHARPDELDRFRAEALAVARIRHPNIVQIFDVGESDGLPYFALEFVEGGTLETEADGKPMATRRAASLVETLARAMASAHAEKIIHRDLKPANILLGLDGQPKVTDFGLAKRLEDDSGQTRTGAVMGTPSYMSPEQAWGWTDRIGPAADIYALGAILYDLLTGRPPFQGVTTLETLDLVRHTEAVSPVQLQPKIARDLETICLKCLQKEPQRRYATASDLADDLGRYLRNEPILARPVSRAERTWRWARRNPWVAGLGSAVALLLVAVAVGSTVFSVLLAAETKLARDAAHKADVARGKEEVARKEADRNADAATKSLALTLEAERGLLFQVQDALRTRPELLEVREAIVRSAMNGLEKVRLFSLEHPLTAQTEAAGIVQLGSIFLEFGRVDEASTLFDSALATLAAQARDQPGNAVARRNLAAITNKCGDVALRLGDGARARRLYQQALDLRREWSEMVPDADGPRQSIAESLSLLGGTDVLLGDPRAADAHYRASFAEYEALPLTRLDDPNTRLALNSLKDMLGVVRLKLGDVPGAEERHRAAQEGRLKLFQETKSTSVLRDIALSQLNFGDLHLISARDPVRAWAEFTKAFKNFDRVLKAQPEGYTARRDMAMILYRLGETAERLKAAGKAVPAPAPNPAETYFAECLKIREALAKIDPRDTQAQIDRMIALARCGRGAEAELLADGLLDGARGDPQLLFQSACAFALCGRDPNAAVAAKARGRSLAVVADLIKNGWKDRFALETDPDLESIRADPSFERLLASLPPAVAQK